MRRSSISMRLGSMGSDVDAILTRRPLIEELLSRQYNPSVAVANEMSEEIDSGGQGSVTLLMRAWDNKNITPLITPKPKHITARNELANAEMNSARSNIYANAYKTFNSNIDTDSISNRSYSIYTGESDAMAVMIDDDLALDDYDDEEQDIGDYDDADDDYDDDDIENFELAEALRMVRGNRALNINDYIGKARYKSLKRKAENVDNNVAVKNENCSNECHDEKKSEITSIRMIKLIIEGEPNSNSKKSARGVQSSKPAMYYKGNLISCDEQDDISEDIEKVTKASPESVEAYEPVDREVCFCF